MHTKAVCAGSCDVSLVAWSPSEPMKITKQFTVLALEDVMACLKCSAEIPYRLKFASEKRMRNLKNKETKKTNISNIEEQIAIKRELLASKIWVH